MGALRVFGMAPVWDSSLSDHDCVEFETGRPTSHRCAFSAAESKARCCGGVTRRRFGAPANGGERSSGNLKPAWNTEAEPKRLWLDARLRKNGDQPPRF